jgi:GDSL-like Lipase/Acylhydrolase family
VPQMSKNKLSAGHSARLFRNNVLLRGLLVFGGIVVVALCAVEVLLRIIGFTEYRILSGNVTGAHVFDAELGWFLRPNAVTQHATTNRTTSVRQNSLGLRERELSDIASNRIMFLGDSFTWGYDAEVNERFTDLLQKELPQYGVVNAGVSGYGTDQELLLMYRLWKVVSPKVVVLTFCVDNDRDDNSSSLRYRQRRKPYFVRTPDGRLQARGYPLPRPEDVSHVSWSERLVLVGFVVDIYAKLREQEIIVPDLTESLIDLMRRTVEERGARLVVGLQRHEPKLEAHLRAREIPYTTFEDAPGYPTAGWHWTPQGNAIVARKYLVLFTEIGIVPGPLQPSNRTAPPRADRLDGQAAPNPTSILSPSMWLAAAKALPSELSSLVSLLEFWTAAVRDSRGAPRVVAAMVILAVAAVSLIALVVWWRLRVKAAGNGFSRFGKALRSFGVFLALALLIPLAVIVLLEATEVHIIEITYGLVVGILVGEFGRAVALAVFSPDDPRRRLVTVSDATARSLARHLIWGARGLGVLLWALAIHKVLAAQPVLINATDALFALFICALLLHLLWTRRRGSGAEAPPPWLRNLGWLSVGAIVIALVAGHPAAGSFVAARLVSIVAVFGMLYLLLTLGSELFAERLALDSPRSLAIAADFGVSARWLGLAAVLTGVGMGLALLLAAFVLYTGPW